MKSTLIEKIFHCEIEDTNFRLFLISCVVVTKAYEMEKIYLPYTEYFFLLVSKFSGLNRTLVLNYFTKAIKHKFIIKKKYGQSAPFYILTMNE